MSAFKKLSKSDVTVVPYHANKQWELSYCPFPNTTDYLIIHKGTNVTGSFNVDTDPQTWYTYERLVYNQINHLFYQSYTASLDTSSLANSIYYESASEQRPTSSYFVYNDNANLINYFPTGAMEGIRVLSVNQNIYVNKLLPNNFILSSSAYYILDDGFGNLYDQANINTHVGNIFYAHGMAVITNQDYQLMFPYPPLAYNDYAFFVANEPNKIVYPLLNDDGRGRTFLTGSLSLSGSATALSNWTNNGDGSVTLNASTIGRYVIYYTVYATGSGECGPIISNQAKITVDLIPVSCDFRLIVTPV